jgi:membrane fusion protein, adhesin transport system
MIAATPTQRRAYSEIAYRERSFPALRLARGSRLARRVAKVLLFVLFVTLAAMLAIPWQQTAYGRGRVIAYDPLQRPQDVRAPIAGRITNWQPNCFEGAIVKRGDLLFEIEVIDQGLITQVDMQRRQTESKLAFDRLNVATYNDQIRSYEEIRVQAEKVGDADIEAAIQKLAAAKQDLTVAEADLELAELDRVRYQNLFAKGSGTQQDAQDAKRKAISAQAKVNQARQYIKVAEADLNSKREKRAYEVSKAQANIDAKKGELAKAEGDIQNTLKDLADIDAKATLQRQKVTATQDGQIVHMKEITQEGQIVSVGAALFELVPVTADRAVELKIDGNDVLLAASKDENGNPRKVRMQFEAWPSVQFSGWPSVAVGTFGGVISVVDTADDGFGKFRVIVAPDPEGPPWPHHEFLRQGTQATGWVLLNEVPLGWEVWRQLNAFPPVISLNDPEKTGDKSDEKLLRSKK